MSGSSSNPEPSRTPRAQKFEALGFIAAGIAHELNNLLMIISASTDLLQQGTGDPAHHIESIRTAAARAAEITEEILAFDRKQLLQTRVLDACEMVKRSLAALQQLLEPAVRVVSHLPGAPLWIEVDETKVSQILMNLGLHARGRMASGGTLEVSLAHADVKADEHPGMPGGKYVRIRFHDSGASLDATAIEHLFDPFASAKSMAPAGLALPVAYQVIKNMRGWIWAGSRPDQGVTFDIYFLELDAPAQTAAQPASKGAKAGETVLVVDDQKLVRAVTVDFLKSQGYNVLEASSGAQALEIAAGFTGAIDALVSDVVMPGMEGPELALRLREVRPQLKVIFISGYAAEGADMRRSLADGARFLSKPTSLQALASELRSLLK